MLLLKHDVDRTVLVQTIGEGKIQIILAVADGCKWNPIPVAGTPVLPAAHPSRNNRSSGIRIANRLHSSCVSDVQIIPRNPA